MFTCPLPGGPELRLLESRHAREVFAAVERNRDYLRQWLPWVDRTHDVSDIELFIQNSLEQFAENNGFAAGIWLDAEYIGTIGCHKIDWANRKVELGYWLAERFQGRGIMTSACTAVLRHLFTELKLNRVEIHCATGNNKSCAIPQRLGFQFEGIRREGQILNGHAVDIRVFAMLSRDWNNQSEAGMPVK